MGCPGAAVVMAAKCCAQARAHDGTACSTSSAPVPVPGSPDISLSENLLSERVRERSLLPTASSISFPLSHPPAERLLSALLSLVVPASLSILIELDILTFPTFTTPSSCLATSSQTGSSSRQWLHLFMRVKGLVIALCVVQGYACHFLRVDVAHHGA